MTGYEQLDVAELKKSLTEFDTFLTHEVINDPEYEGDADILLEAIKRVLGELKDVKDNEDFHKRKFNKCLPDIVFIFYCINEFFSQDDEDYDDMDDEDFDDLDDEDFDDIEFDDEELEEEVTPPKKGSKLIDISNHDKDKKPKK